MILVMDIGNTNIKVGIFDNDELRTSWRLSVTTQRTADEYYTTMYDLFKLEGLDISDIVGVIISSVVPALNYTLEHMFTYYFDIKPIMVSAKLNTGLIFDYYNTEELGADRIVNAVASYTIYGGATIICDLGTATTLGAIDSKGCFLGGAIAPGLKSSVDALASNTARLHRIELITPPSAIGRNTAQNMQSGAIYGFTGLISSLISRFKAEMNEEKIIVVATGGLSELIDQSQVKLFDVVDRALTLKGLYILYTKNCKKNKEV